MENCRRSIPSLVFLKAKLYDAFASQTFSPNMNKTESHRHVHEQTCTDFNSWPNHLLLNYPVRNFPD